jgi:hypothetical protein
LRNIAAIAAALLTTSDWLLGSEGQLLDAEDNAFFSFYRQLPQRTKEQIRAITRILGTHRQLVTREEAERRVLSGRGSYDAPGFEACVQAKMSSHDSIYCPSCGSCEEDGCCLPCRCRRE